ncbi:MAG: hypothetical protein K9G43_01780 [Rhodobacteraceae bacterium]|jgi:hypothetical protein|nr:hypothetical protein [Paracoccaceae bacterium]
MLFKIILIFLLGMALIGMIGKALFPGRIDTLTRLRRNNRKTPVCSRCGRYIIGQKGCDCGKS